MGLLTAEELRNVGRGLKNVFALPEDGEFDDLLARIEQASRRGPPRR